MIDQLPPHSILTLVLEQRSHHLLIAVEYLISLGMVRGQFAKHFSHAGSYPTVTAAPIEGDVRSVIEEAVRLLQLFQIRRHLHRVTVEILLVSRSPVGFQLQDG